MMVLKEIDLIINKDYESKIVSDSVASHNIPTGKYDLYEILLHELGHAISQSHVIDSTKVMWYKSSKGATSAKRRIRLFSDSPANDGGDYVVEQSQNPDIASCGWEIMSLLYPFDCIDIQGTETVNNYQNGFFVYPNPTSDGTIVSFNLITPSNVSFTVYDILGKETYRNKIGTLAKGSHEIKLNTTNLSSGLYLIQLTVSGENYYQKLIKE